MRSWRRISLGRDACYRPPLRTGSSYPGEKREQFRFLHVSTDEVYGDLAETEAPFTRDDAVCAELAVRRDESRLRSLGARVEPNVRAAGARDELLEQLRPVSVSGEIDSAHDLERAARCAVARLRRRQPGARLVVSSTTMPARFGQCSRRASRARRTTSAGTTSGVISTSYGKICRILESLRPRVSRATVSTP